MMKFSSWSAASKNGRVRDLMRRTADLFTLDLAEDRLFDEFGRMLFDALGVDAVLLAARDGDSPRVTRFIGRGARAIPAVDSEFARMLDAVMAGGEAQLAAGVAGAKSGVFVPLRLSGAIVGVLGVLSERPRGFHSDDISFLESAALHLAVRLDYGRQRSARAQLEELAATDALTEVANRRTFDERLRIEWGRAGRNGEPLALIMIDVDHFKLYNDTYGHVAGDHVLHAAAGAMARCLSRPGDFIARYGGEEFAVILPGTTQAGARAIAERMRGAVAALEISHGEAPGARLSISAGVASAAPKPDGDPQAFVAEADHALYAAKADGRDRVVAGP